MEESMASFGAFLLGGFVAAVLLLLVYYLRRHKEYHVYIVLRHQEVMVIERFGKFNRIIKSGFHIILPLIERPRIMHWRFSVDPRTGKPGPVIVARHRIDLRETVYDFPEQTVITSDNAQITIDGLVLLQIMQPYNVVYNVTNFPAAIESLTEAGLRNVIGGITLEKTLISRDEINNRLKEYLGVHTLTWGVEIKTVEIKNIIPDQEVFKSMVMQSVEGRHRLALQQRAQAEKYYLEEVKKAFATEEAASQYLATIRYVDAFKELVNKKDGKVVFIPYESSNLMGSLNIIREFFEDQAPKKPIKDTTPEITN
jgi:regulator of protease activity HflC (stomatin/prohibitin superfamily)